MQTTSPVQGGEHADHEKKYRDAVSHTQGRKLSRRIMAILSEGEAGLPDRWLATA